jgi:hypothetical protein
VADCTALVGSEVKSAEAAILSSACERLNHFDSAASFATDMIIRLGFNKGSLQRQLL